MINKYRFTRYKKYGRGPDEIDCWGIVRTARAELFGKDLLPSYSEIDPQDTRALTQACEQVRVDHVFNESPPVAGAIATAWRARVCVHAGLVDDADGRESLLESAVAPGPCSTRIHQFEQRYTKVIYYDDSDLPKPHGRCTYRNPRMYGDDRGLVFVKGYGPN